MGQNITQPTATGTFSDASTQDITNTVTWSTSDSSIVFLGFHGAMTMQPAGKVWGADVGLTATLAPGTPGTSSLLVIASDSGSVAPRMPQQNNHWQALGLSPWGSWWGCQEATGNLVGSGSAAFTLTALGGAGQGVQYVQPPSVSGDTWTRTALAISGTAGTSVSAGAGVGPNPSTTSTAFLAYGLVGQGTVNGNVMGVIATSAANRITMTQNPTTTIGSPALSTPVDAKVSVGPRTHRHNDRVHPYLLVLNRTSGEIWLATDECVAMSSSLPATADDVKGWGNRAGVICTSASLTYFAVATGSIVEALCSVSASADFLSRLGWRVNWKDCPTESGSIKAPFLVDHYKGLGVTPWTSTWNCQEAASTIYSFDRLPGLSSEGWKMAANATPLYELTSPGWLRKGVGFGGANQRFSVAGNYGPPISWDPTGSFAALVYISGSTVAASARPVVGIGASLSTMTAACLTTYNAAGNPIVYCAGMTATGSQNIVDNRVHPWLLVYDRTNARVKLYTDLEKITGSFNQLAVTSNITGSLVLGAPATSGFTTPATFTCHYLAFTTGSNAELYSDDGQASALLKAYGWAPTW